VRDRTASSLCFNTRATAHSSSLTFFKQHTSLIPSQQRARRPRPALLAVPVHGHDGVHSRRVSQPLAARWHEPSRCLRVRPGAFRLLASFRVVLLLFCCLFTVRATSPLQTRDRASFWRERVPFISKFVCFTVHSGCSPIERRTRRGNVTGKLLSFCRMSCTLKLEGRHN
jgi:hypothetical protein